MEKETAKLIVTAAAIITMFCTGIFSQSSAGSEESEKLKTNSEQTFQFQQKVLSQDQADKFILSYKFSGLDTKRSLIFKAGKNVLPELNVQIEEVKFSRLHIPEKKLGINLRVVF